MRGVSPRRTSHKYQEKWTVTVPAHARSPFPPNQSLPAQFHAAPPTEHQYYSKDSLTLQR
ncbi:hypothetical protein E2C01_066932 [Portunus trituberculatus]|uniref:Uncharacterized protein n=1 Tax=Portunus trituberculatus TaxID=210409 RepID=A0A5B7HJJ3_PORTR|nr:hypothetical protein [Portunus trituberculatus]